MLEEWSLFLGSPIGLYCPLEAGMQFEKIDARLAGRSIGNQWGSTACIYQETSACFWIVQAERVQERVAQLVDGFSIRSVDSEISLDEGFESS